MTFIQNDTFGHQTDTGLSALKDYKFAFNDPDNYKEELKAEEAMREDGHKRYMRRLEKMTPSSTPENSSIIIKHQLLVAEEIERQIKHAEDKTQGRYPTWYEEIKDLDTEVLAVGALSTMVDCVVGGSALSSVNQRLGRVIEMERWAREFRSFNARLESRLLKKIQRDHSSQKHRRAALKAIAGKEGFQRETWSSVHSGKVGTVLYNSVMMATDLFEVVVEETYIKGEKKTKNRIAMQSGVVDELAAITEANAWSDPLFNPMITKPVAWKTFDDLINESPYERTSGCYLDPALAAQVPLVRGASAQQLGAVRKALRDGTMAPMLKALNAIQDTPYEINTPMLEVLEWAWDNKKVFAKFPRAERLEEPEFPEDEWEDMDADARKRWRLNAREVKEKNREIDGLILVMNSDLRTAKRLASGEHVDASDPSTKAFWLPHNWDFRSRVYPIPSFNHHRDDHIRSLFLLHNKKPIGQSGFEFIAMKVAEHGDFGKISKEGWEQRLKWVADNEERILQIAADFQGTFDGDDDELYWSKADKPFQFLAACMEFRQATIHGADYESGFPIGLDGTNSGVQHFSALNRSSTEGSLVNLVPSDKPADIYRTVADLTAKQVEADSEADPVARIWKDHGITRSLVKRNVMTFVYSSGLYGFKEQLWSDFMKPVNDTIFMDGHWNGLKENPFTQPYHDHETGEFLRMDQGREACKYLAKANWNSVNSVILSAASGMSFIRKISEVLADEGHNFGYTTPLGFPMLHRYSVKRSKPIKVYLYDKEFQSMKRSQMTYKDTEGIGVNKRKSSSAASPNWIHCLDSLHLHSTVLKCLDTYDVDAFMMIHDSFATVPADAAKMFVAVREAFVEQYNGKCLYQDLRDQAEWRLSEKGKAKLPNLPSKGDLSIEDVKESMYCFL